MQPDQWLSDISETTAGPDASMCRLRVRTFRAAQSL